MRMVVRLALGTLCPALLVLVAGCSATNASVDGERDAELAPDKYYMTVLVAAVNVPRGEEGPMEVSLCKYLPVQRCYRAAETLPLDSRLTTSQIHEILMRQGIQSVLVLTLVGDTAHPSLVGDDTDPIANGYGLSALVGNANDPEKANQGSSSIPKGGRVATFSVRLKDADSLRNSYSGAATIKGKGYLYTKDDSFLYDSSKTIAKELTLRGFFRRRPPKTD